jgi:hypothetical protein
MKRPRLNPRKLLVASAGVATINYALAAGCSGKKGSEHYVIANLMPGPPGFEVDDATLGNGGSSPVSTPTVANLVAPPPPVSPPPVSFEPRDAGAKDAGDADTDAG